MSKLLRIQQVVEKTTLKKSTIYTQINNGTFPKPIKIGDKAIAWVESEINEWINKLREERK